MPSPRSLTAAAALVGLLALPSAAAAADKMLTVITSDNAETQAMALVLSNQVAGKGGEVDLLLCGPAGDIARKEAPAAAQEIVTPKGMTVRLLLEALLSKGATVEVCAIYLPNRDLTADALMPDVGVAEPPMIADKMRDPGTKLFTF